MSESSIQWDLLSEDFLANPYPTYEAMRDSGQPLLWSEDLGCWLVSRYAHISDLLRDKRILKDPRYSRLTPTEQASELLMMKSRWMLYRDGPFHSRMKQLQTNVLSPRANGGLDELARVVVDELLKHVKTGEWFDVMEVLALDLPYLIISTLLGVPDEDRAELRHWSRDLFGTLEPGMTQEKWDLGEVAAKRLREYFAHLLTVNTMPPPASMMAQYRQVLELGRAPVEDIEATCALMFLTGHETTSYFLGNAILALSRNPEQLAYANKGGFSSAAISELLRFDGPVHNTSRVAASDLLVEGQQVREGDRLLFLLGSANRDEDAFHDAAKLDLKRKPSPQHLALGAGPHYCPGAWLAQEQALAALQRLLSIGKSWTIDETRTVWRRSSQVRGPESLWLRLDSSSYLESH